MLNTTWYWVLTVRLTKGKKTHVGRFAVGYLNEADHCVCVLTWCRSLLIQPKGRCKVLYLLYLLICHYIAVNYQNVGHLICIGHFICKVTLQFYQLMIDLIYTGWANVKLLHCDFIPFITIETLAEWSWANEKLLHCDFIQFITIETLAEWFWANEKLLHCDFNAYITIETLSEWYRANEKLLYYDFIPFIPIETLSERYRANEKLLYCDFIPFITIETLSEWLLL